MIKSFDELPQETKDFVHNMKAVFNNRFPNSYCKVAVSFSLAPSVFIYFDLAKNADECANKIQANDICGMAWCSFDIDENGVLKDKISFERLKGYGIRRKAHKDDPKEKYLVYSSIPVKYRKTTNEPSKVIKTFEKYVENMANIILENIDEIQDTVGNLYDVKSKVNI